MESNQGLEDGKVKVILETVPDEVARQKCIALLSRLFRKATHEQLEQLLAQLPFLVGSFHARKAEQLSIAFERCGAKVRLTPLASDDVKGSFKPDPSIVSTVPVPETPVMLTRRSSFRTSLLAIPLLVITLCGGVYWYSFDLKKEPVATEWFDDVERQSKQVASDDEWRLLCSATKSKRGSDPGTVLDVQPQDMRNFLTHAYRLDPDIRLTRAFCHISLLGSGHNAKIRYRFHRGQWEFDNEGVKIGVLSELPGFGETMELAMRYASSFTLNNKEELSPVPMSEIRSLVDSFWAPAQFQALTRLDEQWQAGEIDPELFQLGAEAMLHIQFQTLDRVGMSDDLSARTLALIALAKSKGLMMARESALLAKLMGYEAASYRLASALNDQDGAKHYIQKGERRLLVLAARKNAPIDTRFFLLDDFARQREIDSWAEWVNDRFGSRPNSLALIKSALDLNDFTLNPLIARWLPNLVLMEMAQNTDNLKPLSEWPKPDTLSAALSFTQQFKARAELLVLGSDSLVKRFELEMQRLEERPGGRFMEPAIEQAYYASAFWSSQRIRGLHYLDRLSSEEASKRFSDELGSGDSAISQQFLNWYRHLADSKSGKSTARIFSDDLRELDELQWPLQRRSLRERRKYLSYGDPFTSSVIKQAVRYMDSRPSHRYDLAGYADEMLFDLPLAIRLYQSLVKTAPTNYASVKIWLDGNGNDIEALRAMLNDESQTEANRLSAFKWLRDLEVPVVKESQRLFRGLIKDDPDNWKLRRRIVDYLEEQKDYSAARKFIEPWLAARDRSAGFPWLFANTALARMYYHEGEYHKSWEILEPIIESQQFGVMRWGALTLNALDRTDDAASLAKAAYERYPDLLKALMLNLELDWKNTRFSQATVLLKSHPHPIGSEAWRWKIGPLFSNIFPERLLPQGKAAAQALADAGVGAFELQQLSFALKDAGNLPLAFDVASRLRWPGMGQLDLTIGAYGVLKKWRGEAAALEWVRKQIPPRAVNRVSTMLYANSHYELLWSLIGEPLPDDHPEFVWLMRAAGAVQEGVDESPYRLKLETYYSESSREYYHMIGRYLLGMENEVVLLDLATAADKRSEVAYYLAIKAESEGRLQAASDWYRVSVETGLRKEGEYRWAYNRLSDWRNKRESAFFSEVSRSTAPGR